MDQVPGTDVETEMQSRKNSIARIGAKGSKCLAPLALRFFENPLD